MNPERELELLRMMRTTSAYLEGVRDDEKVLMFCLRSARDLFGGGDACLAVPSAGRAGAEVFLAIPRERTWDAPMLAAFLRGERPPVPFDVLLAPLRRRGRRWAVVGVRRHEGTFQRGDGWQLVALADHVSGLLARLDAERVRAVRARIDRKIMEQLRPHDLFYQILDALRALTRYDHSSALLVATEQGNALELIAEQLAWHKGRSRRIGMKLPLDEALVHTLRAGGVHGFTRDGDIWREWTKGSDPVLASLLDSGRPGDGHPEVPRERQILCAPLATRDGAIGVIRIASLAPDLLGEHEREVLREFTSHASVAIQYLRGTESLKSRMVEAERKNAIATIARGVAHDVNNALGSVLPLVQQMQVEVETGAADPARTLGDLGQIEEAVHYCRRIFRNMLSFALTSPGKLGHANVRRAVDGTLAILRGGLDRAGVLVEVDVAEDLQQVRGVQGDLERLVFNFVTNARDAMAGGGTLTVAARPASGGVLLTVQDTGCGMTPEILERLFEPGFTTKQDGNGLGLSVCRAIVWSIGGEMKIESAPGRGTRVSVLLSTDLPDGEDG